MHRFSLLLCVCLMIGAAAESEQPSVVTDLIRRQVVAIEGLNTYRADHGVIDKAFARDYIRQHISSLFDFQQMTKFAVGKYWRRADEATQQQLVDNFQQLLETVYAKVLIRYDGQVMSLVGSRESSPGRLSVLTEVSGKGGKSVQVEYIVKADTGLVIDVKVEKVSLLANYRRQFAQIARKEGVEGLVTRLSSLVAKAGS